MTGHWDIAQPGLLLGMGETKACGMEMPFACGTEQGELRPDAHPKALASAPALVLPGSKLLHTASVGLRVCKRLHTWLCV